MCVCLCVCRAHLVEVVVLFMFHQVEGVPLILARSCQQVVEHVIVSEEETGGGNGGSRLEAAGWDSTAVL